MPAADPAPPGVSLGGRVLGEETGVLLNGSLSLRSAPGQDTPAHLQSPYTETPRGSVCLKSAGSSGEVDSAYLGQETPKNGLSTPTAQAGV